MPTCSLFPTKLVHIMKKFFTFAFIAVLFFPPTFGQVPKTLLKVRSSTWDKPFFEPEAVAKNNISAIRVTSSQQVGNRSLQTGKHLAYRFDDRGNMVQFAACKDQDTSYLEAFAYTESGGMKWSQIENKSWNKTFKEGYRLNRNKTVFQAKSYEVVNRKADEVVLLHTKQYVYLDGKDSLLQTIRYLENERLVKQERFNYDQQDRLADELMLDSRGDTLKHIAYSYSPQDLLTRIVTREGVNVKESNYTYDTKGNPTRVQWLENGQIKGMITYTYDAEGMLTEMQQTIDERKSANTVHTFEYEKRGNPTTLAVDSSGQ
jgi:hypothetical protein